MPEHIRHRVLPSDRGAVTTLVEASGSFRPNEVEVAEEQVREHLARGGAASGYHFAFIERDARLAGYVCYGPITVTLGSWSLYWIVVHPDYQRQGLGSRLLADVEERIIAAEGRQIYVETPDQPAYLATQSFYKRAGYGLAATLNDFYAPGDDKLVFVKRLLHGAGA